MNNKKNRMTDESILNQTMDKYMNCPNCKSFNLYRDLRHGFNECKVCLFDHYVGEETISQALMRYDIWMKNK